MASGDGGWDPIIEGIADSLASLNALVVGVDLRGRGDVQQFRLEMPGVKVTKGLASDARLQVEMRREFFNVMARDGKVPDWIEAFTYGQAKATGPDQFLRLITNVVEKQQERERARRARRHP